MTKASLLGKPSDADSDTLSIITVSAASQRNGTVVLNANGVTYSPAVDFTGQNAFTIMIADGHGGSIVGAVNVTMTTGAVSSAGQSTLAVRPDGSIDALFYGTAGSKYAVQRSVNLVTWITLQSVPTGDDGIVAFTDTAPVPAPKAFYRIQKTTP